MYTKQKKMSVSTKIVLSIIFSVTVITLIYCFSEGINGNDFWWHIKAGEWICEHGYVPKKDIFSWYGIQKGISWTPHEWLAEVIFYQIYRCAGEFGIYLFSFAAAVIMLVLLWMQAREHIIKNVLISGVFFGIAAVIFYTFFYGRPHIFCFFLLYFELKCLYGFWENQRSKWIYLIPVLACFWSNLHGGSSNLSYILCIVTLIAIIFPWKIGCIHVRQFTLKSKLKLLLVTCLSVLAILVNPVGVDILSYPYVNMGDRFILGIISEWSAPDAKNIWELILYFVPMGLLLLGFFAEDQKIEILDLLLTVCFLLLFFRSVRFIILWDIAACFCAFPYMPECRVKEIKTPLEKGCVTLFTMVLLVPLGIGVQKMYQTAKSGEMISKVMTEDMIQVVKKENPQKLLNDYNYGEALIFHDIKVFVDSRADLFAVENILKDAASLMYLIPQASGIDFVDVEQLFEKYQFDGVVMQKNRAFYSYMLSHPERFRMIYEEKDGGYFRVIKMEGVVDGE